MSKLLITPRQARAAAKKRPDGNAWDIYKRLLAYGKPYWIAFVIAVVANMAYSGIDSLFVYLLKPLLNKGFITPDVRFLSWLPFIIIGLFILRSIMNLVGSYSMGLVARSIVMSFRQQLFAHLLHMPASFYDRSSSGQMLSMLVYNAAQVSSACTDAVTILIQNGALVLGLLVVMLSISWQLTLIFIVTGPLLALTVKLCSSHLRRLSRNAQEAMADITHVAEEAIEGYKVVRTFGGESYEINKFNQATAKNMFWELKLVVVKAINDSTVQLVGISVVAIMVYLATKPHSTHALSAGSFAAIIAAMMAMLKPMRNLTSVNGTIQRGLAGAESIFQILDLPPEKNEGKTKVDRVVGDITYHHVNLNYEQSEQQVLTDINLNVKAGQTIALVGRSGSGKTSLVSLLPRFYDRSQGQITIDGIDIFDMPLSDLRKQIALVTQHVTLFNDTIANNIAYGLDVTDEQVMKAVQAAHALEFIEKLPDGIHTLIGENGVLLSGGQRQRIAIARAILKDAPILILDEATSALDTESERHIQAALEAVMENRTTLVIAHRLSTIENADLIVVLENGVIVQRGTHAELITQGGAYRMLHELQFTDVKVSALNTASAE